MATGDADSLVELRDLPEPEPVSGELVVSVEASSVNHGEVEWLQGASAGWRPGWDLAGRVAVAADGGPPGGSRVVGFLGEGAWSERVAVPTARVAVVPDTLDLAAAAALPVVGLTALRALRRAGSVAGRRVLITGASGAIGRVAVQLAARADARVTALVRASDIAARLLEFGAAEVITVEEVSGPYDAVLDGVGGPALAAALTALAPGGRAVLYGDASHEPTAFNAGDLFLRAPEASVHALRMDASGQPERFGSDLAHLAELVATGALELDVGAVRSWHKAAAVLADARARRDGKTVLRFDRLETR